MTATPIHLGQILVARKEITEQQLEHALNYQALHNKPVGHCLVALGYINQTVVNRALRRQSWLKPCAACLTCLCAPFTFSPCIASENIDEKNLQEWTEQQDPYSNWNESIHLSGNNQAGIDFVKVAAEAAWGIYQGEPKSGEWQYSLSKQSSGYAVSMEMHF